MFKGSFKSVSRKFQECFQEVSRVLQGSLKGVSRKFQECSKDALGKVQGCLRKFQGLSIEIEGHFK